MTQMLILVIRRIMYQEEFHRCLLQTKCSEQNSAPNYWSASYDTYEKTYYFRRGNINRPSQHWEDLKGNPTPLFLTEGPECQICDNSKSEIDENQQLGSVAFLSIFEWNFQSVLYSTLKVTVVQST